MTQQELTGGTSNICPHGLSWPYCCWCHSHSYTATELSIKEQLDRVEGKLDALLKCAEPVNAVNRFVKWVP